MKTLVTGGAGFIGSNVVALLLERGHEVTVLDNLSSGNLANLDFPGQVKLVRGDVRDEKLVRTVAHGVEAIFHLAASVGNAKSLEDPHHDAEVNVLGTINILEAAKESGVRKIVFSSSAAIFGELTGSLIAEEHPAEPDSPYGASKLAAEKLCLAYSRLHPQLEAVCLRYFNVFGTNQRFDAYGNVIPIFAHHLLRGEPITIYGDGQQTRDFIHVSDVARANVVAGENRGVSGAFNLGSGRSISINKLAIRMQNWLGAGAPILHAPPRSGDVRHSKADIRAIRRALDFSPLAEFDESLRAYLAWFRRDRLGNPARK
jgi:UDP-glucose 4-epimerase